jgi:Protein of unknown function (DUF4058)
MDPWLESPGIWPDVHNRLIAALSFRLGPILRPRYFVRLEERIYLSEPGELLFVGRPDLLVHGKRPGKGPRRHASEPSLPTAAVTVEVPVPDRVKETYLEVHEVATGDVVTVFELLSPSNKRPGEGRRIYLEKRNAILGTRTSLVEVDLLRAGDAMPLLGAAPTKDYRILVSRGNRRPRADLWSFSVRDPIPRFRVPLRSGDPEPEIDLSSVLAEVYDASAYDLSVDYSKPPVPRLAAADRAWAASVLRAAARKKG